MPEKKSLLDQLNVKDKLESRDSPFAKEEKTKPLRIRESKYDLVNMIAFKTGTKKVDVLDNILEAGIKKLKLREQYKDDL